MAFSSASRMRERLASSRALFFAPSTMGAYPSASTVMNFPAGGLGAAFFAAHAPVAAPSVRARHSAATAAIPKAPPKGRG